VSKPRSAFTLLELLVIIGIIGVLFALLAPAIQRARDASQRTQCGNNLHQIGLALVMYHDLQATFPPGDTSPKAGETYPWMSWLTRILPFVEQGALWQQAQQAYLADPLPFDNPPHVDFATPVSVFTCPADPRSLTVQPTHNGLNVSLTSYVGVNGADFTTKDGILYIDSHVAMSDITDGSSNTLGERPPSADFWYGWWYAGIGQMGSGSPDQVLGVRELNRNARWLWFCPPGPYHLEGGQVQNQCDTLHFWSPHSGGANFLFADGSVHFLSYSVDPLMPALATRAGGEVVSLP
jgi:prepilin-type processing-associated H-X9-DG protein